MLIKYNQGNNKDINKSFQHVVKISGLPRVLVRKKRYSFLGIVKRSSEEHEELHTQKLIFRNM